MNADTITLKEVLQYIDSPEAFSMRVYTANKIKQTGGEEIILTRAWGHTSLTRKERAAVEKAQQYPVKYRRNPNHYNNSTRNIRLQNGGIITIHIRLIRELNGKTVL